METLTLNRSQPDPVRRLGLATRAFLFACAACASGAGLAAGGDLDPTFGAGGKATLQVGTDNDNAHAIAIQADGRILVAGSSWNGRQYVFVLARYRPDGTLDATFGAGGIAQTAGPLDTANAMALQPDGRIVLAGSAYAGGRGLFALARYRPDGTLDPAFGTGGIVTTAVGMSDALAYAVALQPDGRIVAAGYANNATGEIFAVARYNADGSPDTTFNGTGNVTTPVGTLESMAQAVLVQPDGRIVATGWGSSGPGAPFFALVRYNLNGALDASFNGTGVVMKSLGSTYSQSWAAALQPDGRILVGGDSWIGGGGQFALARYNPDGGLDITFNGAGYALTPVGANANINALAIQPDGKIVAAGTSGATSSGKPWYFSLVRYNPNGSLDTTFAPGGIVNTPVGAAGNDYISAVAIQHDGKIVAAGTSGYGAQQQAFALARYQGDPLPSATVVEYYDSDLDNYFITADPAEQAYVDTGAVGRWQRTGLTFKAGGVALVCRFGGNYATNPATGAFFGPNSHFFTGDADECAQLKALYDARAKSWHFESYDFATTPAPGGLCATGLVPVYRAYNNGFARGVDSNHRFTTSAAEYQKMIGKGWAGEGAVFCSLP